MASDSDIGLFDSIVNEKVETSVKVRTTLENGVKQELFDSGEYPVDPLYPDENPSNPERQEEHDDTTLDEIQIVFDKLAEEEGEDLSYEKRLTKKYVKDEKESPSSIKFDYLCPRPQRGEGGSDDDSVNGDDDDDEDEIDEDDKQRRGRRAVNSCPFERLPTKPSTSKNVASENETDADNVAGGPIEQIQHVRKQIKSTKAEIAKLEKMMSHIADLRHALSERDTTQGLNQLAQLSIKDFEEFQTYLLDLPDNESKNVKKEGVDSDKKT